MENLLEQVKAKDEAFAVEHRGDKSSLSELDKSPEADES